MDRASPLHHRQGFPSPPWTGLPLSTIWRCTGQLCWLSHIQRIKQYLTVYLIRLGGEGKPCLWWRGEALSMVDWQIKVWKVPRFCSEIQYGHHRWTSFSIEQSGENIFKTFLF
jgi:hypothetical protein